MANPSISIPDEDLEKFDRILQVQAMLGERDNDRRSPVFQDFVESFIEKNKDDLKRYEAFVEGNSASQPATVTAD